MHEAELFGLRRMGDAPTEDQLLMQSTDSIHDDNDQQLGQPSSITDEQTAMRDWLLNFMPLFHARQIDQQPDRPITRLLTKIKAADDHGGCDFVAGEQRVQLAAEDEQLRELAFDME